MSDAVSEAAARLERAVGRLAELAARPRPAEGIPPARVAELAGRLDGTLSRLRTALADLDAAEAAEDAALQAAEAQAGLAADVVPADMTQPGEPEAVASPAEAPAAAPLSDQER